MNLLLDTHALIWLAAGDTRLLPGVRAAIADDANEVFASAASAWESATKARLGKLSVGPLATDFVGTVRAQGLRVVPISARDAQEAGSLPGPHGDPFDRMLAAQALRRGFVLVSNDAALDQFGVSRLWS